MIENLEALAKDEKTPQWGKMSVEKREFVGYYNGTPVYLEGKCCEDVDDENNACSSQLPDC